MQAVVLVGGFGTRLRPLTETIPKQLLPVAGIAMIERVMEGLSRHGVARAVLSMGYLPDPFITAYPSRSVAGVALEFAVEDAPLDTAGAIAFAARSAGIDETFLAVNGDVLTDADLGALVERHRAAGAEGTVLLTPVEDPSRFGVVVTDAGGRVSAWVEKPQGQAPSNDINAGTYVLEPSVIERVPAGAVSIERVIFPEMVAQGTLYGVVDEAYWIDAGTPQAYLQANLDVVDGTRRCACPGTRRGDALLLEGARADDRAVVERSVLGEGVVVAAGAQVRGSVVLERASIGADAVIDDAVIGPGAYVGEGARVTGLALVAPGATVPARSVVSGGAGR